MNYIKHYTKLIERSQHRQTVGYTESHHVVPRCLGGSDAKENLVDLTPEEHFIAHQLLVKIYPSNMKLKFALNMMCNGKNRSNKRYGWIRRHVASALSDLHKGKVLSKEHISVIKESNTGSGNFWYGKTWEEIYGNDVAKAMKKEYSNRMSILNKGENNPMYGKTWEERYGKDESDRRKKIQSEKRKGIPPSTKGLTNTDIYGEEKAIAISNKQSIAKKGKTWDEIYGPDVANKMRKSRSTSRTGKTMSDETKKKMSDARKKYWENKTRSTP